MTPSRLPVEQRWIDTHVGGFVLTSFIDKGGMGAVFKAENRTLGACRAVKILFEDAPDATAVARFLDEARALGAVKHPGLVEVHDCGTMDDGTYFILMEYLRGESLRERLRREGRLPLATALPLLVQIAEALAAVHAQGIVHRDLKPSNIFLIPDSSAQCGTHAKLLDFGIARLRNGGSARTQTGRRTGTPRYMSPEQCEGAIEITERSDIYALALLGTEMLTGSSPYPVVEEEQLAWMFAHVRQRARSLRQLLPDSSPELEGLDPLFKRMLDKAPEQRPSTSEVVAALQRCAGRRLPPAAPVARLEPRLDPPPSAGPAESGVPAGSQTPGSTPLPGEVVRRTPNPSRRLATRLAIGLGLLSLASLSSAAGREVAAGQVTPYAMLGMARFGLGWKLLPRLLDDIDALQGEKLTPPDMAFVPGAVFLMGTSQQAADQELNDCQKFGGPCRQEVFAREVHQRPVLVHSFYLDKTEVTNEAYANWLNRFVPYQTPVGDKVFSHGQLLLDTDHEHEYTHGIEYRDGKFVARPGHEKKPVVQVTWHGARRYCSWRGGELPTEAQWELAARGSVHGMLARSTLYPWGNDRPRCDGVVLGRSPDGPCPGQASGPAPVGTASQDVTPSGIHDLGGNVDEWVLDIYKNPYPSCGWCVDPKYPDPGSADDPAAERSVRGGSFPHNPAYGASAGRSHHAADYDFDGTGFRCAAALRPSTP